MTAQFLKDRSITNWTDITHYSIISAFLITPVLFFMYDYFSNSKLSKPIQFIIDQFCVSPLLNFAIIGKIYLNVFISIFDFSIVI